MLTIIRERLELLVAAAGLLMFWMIQQFSENQMPVWAAPIVLVLAGVYVSIILWKPIRLPEKDSQPLSWGAVLKAGRVTLPVVVISAGINILVSLISPSESNPSLIWFFVYLILLVGLGSAGLAAERSLEADLFPVLRSLEFRWIIYVLVAALFLTFTQLFVDNLFDDLFTRIGLAFGDSHVDPGSAAREFEARSPLVLLLKMLIGAGIFEELLFRVGIMTLVWSLTRRWKLGLLVSAVLFGFYHITPFSGMETYLAAPVSAVLSSFTVGLFTGLVYRYRGFTAVVLMHSLGNWVMIMLFAG
ncbi:MAG: CPBP family intramembrane metalloprotease [Anaerolineales bacterium]|nr:CPBP family intramembrane metalloprotease [Anaerolineales bacterium]